MQEATKGVATLRQLGFAPVEAQARAVLTPLAGSSRAALQIELLGPVRVLVDDKPVPASLWRSQKAIEVLAYLALRGERGAQREEVIEAIWPEREPEKGRMLLRAALSEIRRRLEPGRPAGEPSRFLNAQGDRVALRADVDVSDVRVLARAGSLAEAMARFRGELLEEYPYAEWVMDGRRALSSLRQELADRALHDDHTPYEIRVDAAEFLVAAEPWRDDVLDQLVALHRAAGNDAAARATQRRKETI